MKRFISIIIVLSIMLFCMTGCDSIKSLFKFDTTDELVVDVYTGDDFEIILDNTEGHTIKQNRETKYYEIKDKNETIVCSFLFRGESDLRSYVEREERNLSTYETSKDGDLVYSICQHKDNKDQYVLISYIRGTNTGVLAYFKTDRSGVNSILDKLTFSCTYTTQSDKEYYSGAVLLK